jgi:hypothetical protein
MIKEFAFGTSNRHHFQDASSMSNWQGIDNDTFCSLYDYDDYVKEYYAKHNSLSGFDGLIYMPDEFILDIDGSNTLKARDKLIDLLKLLKQLDVPSKIYFSGTGFHVGIPSTAFRWKPSKDLHLKVKDELNKKGLFDFADPSVTDKTRIIRIVNTRNSKSGLFKVEISNDTIDTMLNCDDESFITGINKMAKSPGHLTTIDLVCEPVFDVLERTNKSKDVAIIEYNNQGRVPDPINYPCIQNMLNGTGYGERHMTALRIAAHLRWRYPEDIVRMIMEYWRQRVSVEKEFKKSEMDGLVEGVYTGHGGSGYRYGCNDNIMDKHCVNTCKLYKAKKSTTTMDAEAMEKELIEFFARDLEPINIGKLYGQDFPIHPGEVVVLQAPPASMKTMLLQNWMVSLKRPTYFIEMEMSPRQIWSRFVMIENNWTHEQLTEHYSQFRNGMEKKFKWLTVDYSCPYPYELEKRITMMAVKPELVVVDHMGLFRSKQRDNNMKIEEVSQSLMELAVRQNVVVFAVSEISKTAFKEGMDISSSRGSFRIAYNANKVISLTPYKNTENGLIEMVHVTSTKNREREFLNARLNVNNVRIEL